MTAPFNPWQDEKTLFSVTCSSGAAGSLYLLPVLLKPSGEREKKEEREKKTDVFFSVCQEKEAVFDAESCQ